MLLVYGAALLGIYKFRSRTYWMLLGFLFVWMLSAQVLFNGGGTIDNPSGDGLITRQIRIATKDGPGMGLFAIGFIVVYWGVAIAILRKMWSVGKRSETERLDSDSDLSENTSAERKIAESVLATALAAAYVYFVFISPQDDKAIDKTAGNQTPNQSAADPVALELAQVAATANKEGPKAVDEITTLERLSAQGRRLTYHYRISRRDVSDEQLLAYVGRNAVGGACKNPDMANAMKNYGVTYRFSYSMPNSDKPIWVDAAYSDCGKVAQ